MGPWPFTRTPALAAAPPAEDARIGPIWLACLSVLVVLSAWLAGLSISNIVLAWPKFPSDFLVFWTAARAPLGSLYDIDALTRAQAWAVTDLTDKRPFAYPPTFLMLIGPFGKLPILPAFLAWTTLGIGLFCAAARQLIGRSWPLMLLSPAFICAALTGQVTFLIGAGLMAGVLLLPRRPLLAGVVFGVVAALKPQAAVMVPLALLIGRHWRPLIAAGAAGAVVGLASWVRQPDLWSQWWRVLPSFSRIIEADPWDVSIGVTPRAAIQQLGWQGTFAEPVLLIAGAALAVATVVLAFRQDTPIRRYGALCVGYLLISPYALWYELALLQPVAVALLMQRSWGPRAAGLVAYTLFGRILCVLAVGAWLVWRDPQPARAAVAGDATP